MFMTNPVNLRLIETAQSLFSHLQGFNVALTITVSTSSYAVVLVDVALSTTDIALIFRLSLKKNTKQENTPEKERGRANQAV
jgi:hypothetical protein